MGFVVVLVSAFLYAAAVGELGCLSNSQPPHCNDLFGTIVVFGTGVLVYVVMFFIYRKSEHENRKSNVQLVTRKEKQSE